MNLSFIWSTNFYNAEASLCEAVNHEGVGAWTPEVPRDSESNFLGGVFLSRRKEVDKSRPVKNWLPQLRCHPAAEDSSVHKAGLQTDAASPSHPPTHPPIWPHFGMCVCVSALVTDTIQSLQTHCDKEPEKLGRRNINGCLLFSDAPTCANSYIELLPQLRLFQHLYIVKGN